MISAKISGNKLIIDLFSMDQKYKEKGKKITFTLFYGTEAKMNSGLEKYEVEIKKEIIYSGEEKVFLELDKLKDGYRGEKIFIGYYLEVNFGKKFFVFKDKKDIDIIGRDKGVFDYKNLKNDKDQYDFKDEYSYKKIIKNMTLLRKSFLVIFFIMFFSGFFIVYMRGTDNGFLLVFFGLVLFLVTFFSAGRAYFNGKIKEDIQDGYFLRDIITGKIKRNLEELRLQLFAYNSEKGKYEESNGSTTRTVSFNREVGSVLLYEKKLKNLKIGDKIENFLDGKLDCEKIYKNLFPTIAVSNDMGLFLNLELKIISKNYKDIYLKREINLEREKFLKYFKEEKEKNNNFNSDFFE